MPWSEIAVLARKRSHFPRLEAELRARGVPCEVVGLGGLLLEPEVVDIVSTLRVLADPTAGNAVVRLLAGPRWRLGPRDLDALGRRARELAVASTVVGAAAGAGRAGGAGASSCRSASRPTRRPTRSTTSSTSAASSTRSTTQAPRPATPPRATAG